MNLSDSWMSWCGMQCKVTLRLISAKGMSLLPPLTPACIQPRQSCQDQPLCQVTESKARMFGLDGQPQQKQLRHSPSVREAPGAKRGGIADIATKTIMSLRNNLQPRRSAEGDHLQATDGVPGTRFKHRFSSVDTPEPVRLPTPGVSGSSSISNSLPTC